MVRGRELELQPLLIDLSLGGIPCRSAHPGMIDRIGDLLGDTGSLRLQGIAKPWQYSSRKESNPQEYFVLL
jgi:hypothetical protein